MDKNEFVIKVGQALSGCQLIEQHLKLYISEALMLVEKCIDKRLPFHMRGEDYEDASLERLIQIFRKLNDNNQLITDLNKFKDDRNFLTHKGISHYLDWEEEIFLHAVRDYEIRLKTIENEAKRLLEAIHEENNKILGPLYFDELKDSG